MEKDGEVSGEGNSYTSSYRQYDPRLGRWKSLDPKSKSHESPFAAYENSPISILDVLGDTTKYFNLETGALMRVLQDGETSITRIKIDKDVYVNGFRHFKLLNDGHCSYGSMSEDLISYVNDYAEQQELIDEGTNYISYQTGLNASFTGTTTEYSGTDREGRQRYFSQGTLRLNAVFDDDSQIEIMNMAANSGPWGFGPIPNGGYSASRIVNTSESGMVRNGVGFKVFLSDNDLLNRTQLRIHPDQTPSEGSAGCIGLPCSAGELNLFRRHVGEFFDGEFEGGFNVNVDVLDNPDYDRPEGGTQNSGE